MSTESPPTTTYTLPDGTQGVAEITVEQPKVPVGKGTQAAFGALALNVIALIAAVIDAGSDWYQDPAIVTLVGTLVAGSVGLLGSRTSQANRMVEQGTAIYQKITSQADLVIAAYQAELAKQGELPPVVEPPPPPPTGTPDPPPAEPGTPDEGSAPDPGTVG